MSMYQLTIGLSRHDSFRLAKRPARFVRHAEFSAVSKWLTRTVRQSIHHVKSEPENKDAVLQREWSGLKLWRSADLDRRRTWGEKEPVEDTSGNNLKTAALEDTLAGCALSVLRAAEPKDKIRLTHRAWEAFRAGQLEVGILDPKDVPFRPSRPKNPKLVPPREVPKPKESSLPLNAYMLHNLAHIELNAIDLAWDTVARFSALGLPKEFYSDFAHVADDESRHLSWCLQRLEELGHSYGDMVAHDLLWECAQISSDDLGWRMCLVPMSQEARGLDAGPRLVEKMVGWGDNRSSAIVEQISIEEKAHVAVGVAWFNRMCEALDQEPEVEFRDTMGRLCPDLLTGFFNHEAREEVGLHRSWYDLKFWPENEASAVAASSGLIPEKPGKRTAPTAPPLSAPQRLTTGELDRLRNRLAFVVGVEASRANSC
uniref:DUF455-domain-containing protein n=1 Tax=Tetraselmis sp. GSL018 TaxID=582737 RepID=A0A061SKE7_9CHLO|mmetsp:Transcript_31992/g.76002  ORF Transcript_31992/g.76002 Transcript_31992/m.76002 type:complete len:428 (+) Transcript_31992:68-1351(+)